MFIHTNRKEAIQFPTDHNGVPSFHVCPTTPGTWHHQMGFKKQGRKQTTKSLAIKHYPVNVQHMKNKMKLVDEWNIYF